MDRRPKDQALRYLGPPTTRRGVVKKQPLVLGAAKSLADLKDYRFFNPAVPYLLGGFREVYWCEWMLELGHDVPLYFHRFEQQVFEGLESRTGDTGWNFGLMAVREEHWELLVDFFCELTVTMRTTQSAVRYGLQELTILDPIAMDRRKVFVGEQTLATIGAFGLYGNKAVAYFDNPPLSRPRLTFREAEPSMVRFAKAYFKERNPLNAADTLQVKPDGNQT